MPIREPKSRRTRLRDSRSTRIVMGTLAALLLALLMLPFMGLIVRTIMMGRASTGALPILPAILLSLGTTAVSTLVIIVTGTPLAYVFARYDFPFKRALNTLIELPIVLPPVVAGLALLMTFGRRGLFGVPLAALGIALPFSTAAVVIAQVFVSAPFYVRAAQTRFQALPRELEDAASMDGATSWQIFASVILPLSWHSLLMGVILAWARALGEFGATILFAGSLPGRTQTMPLLVYGALERDLAAALQLGLILVGMAAAALALTRWLARLDEGDPLA
jgi:molybdate transport system permease protein